MDNVKNATVKKANCHDCRKEIVIQGEEIQSGAVMLQYDNQGKKITVFKCQSCFEQSKELKNYQLCEVYSRMELNLKPGHVIHTLMEEHKMILNFLDGLEKINHLIQQENGYDGNNGDFKRLENIAEHLVGAEPHHQREEQVLFPKLETRGVACPTEVMTKEHEELRPKKKEILNLSQSVAKMDFDKFKKGLKEAADFLVAMLREHIAKENDILYPLALEVIPEEVIWQNMKKECDKIGYCCFTPQI